MALLNIATQYLLATVQTPRKLQAMMPCKPPFNALSKRKEPMNFEKKSLF